MTETSANKLPEKKPRHWNRNIVGVVLICVCLLIAFIVSFTRPSALQREIESRGGTYQSDSTIRSPGQVLWDLVNRNLPIAYHFVELRGHQFDNAWMELHGKELADLSYLFLHLEDTNVTDEGLRELQPVNNIEQLAIRGEQFTNSSLETIALMQNLTRLDISNSSVDVSALMVLKQLQRFSALTVDGTQLNQGAVQVIQKLPRECYLQIYEANDAGLQILAETPGLTFIFLWVRGSEVSDAAVTDLSGMTQLQSLTLIDTAISDEVLAELKAALPNCEIWHSTGAEHDELMRQTAE